MTIVIALLLGIVAGLRAMTPLAAVSWAAATGQLALAGTSLQFLGAAVTPWITSLLALAELVTDQLPFTPSRKVPMQFGTRIVVGALVGAAVTLPSGGWIAGAVAGVVGAVAGTYGGAAARAAMARHFGRDRPAAFIEDAVAIALAALAVLAL
ncbi:DUF4126 family protein [Acuticoccus kandeliae]|uniref:DUF4126 family protein n=1 Tax=Acuticoccus kandeliae TaxID=2073160 RepID=UPI000D3E072B|nr:DUF4126 family protein [Acuticoccus kandeliae]